MNIPSHPGSQPRPSATPAAMRSLRLCALAIALGPVANLSRAADGCEVLLCLASSNWRAIAQCVPPVQRVLRDLARGRPFPICNMAGAGNSASHAWASAPGYCPPQYSRQYQTDSDPIHECDYNGAVSVFVNGAPFSRTWWSTGGDTVTEFSPAAKAQLGTWDTRFDDDYAAWVAVQPPPAAPSDSGG